MSIEDKEAKIASLLSAMLVQAYTADIKHGGNPNLEDIAAFYQRDFSKFSQEKIGIDVDIFNWGELAGPGYDLAICTLIENGTLRN